MKFALIVEHVSLEPWHLDCLKRLEEWASLRAVIVVPSPGPAERRATSPLKHRLVGSDLLRRSTSLTTRVPEHLIVPAKSRERTVQLETLDFALQLGRGPFCSVLPVTPRLGIWAFLHELSGEDFPFLGEVYRGDDITYAALVQRHSQDTASVTLEEGWFRTEKLSYRQQLEQLLPTLASWPARACRRLQLTPPGGASAATSRTAASRTNASRAPGAIRLGALLAGRRLRLAFGRLFRHPQWNVGILPVASGAVLEEGRHDDERIRWFPLRGRKRFLADPFGIVRDGKLHVLCEEFSYRTSRGHIAAFIWPPTDDTTEKALRLPSHLSYPSLVEDEGETYLVPETSSAGEVALYRAVEFPRRWSKAVTLIDGFPGVDPTVFRHEGRWWLTCTERGRHEDAALWVWHSTELKGPWTPHRDNPVKTDVRSARPGGRPFYHKGVLYRPAQDCSKRYGWRIVIQRVHTLTPTEFREETVATLEPSADSPFSHGRHTFTPVGDVILIDGHRFVFVWRAMGAFLGIWARDVAARFGLAPPRRMS